MIKVLTSLILLLLACTPFIGVFVPSGHSYLEANTIGLCDAINSPYFDMLLQATEEALIMALFLLLIFLISLPYFLSFDSISFLRAASLFLIGCFFVAPIIRAFYFTNVPGLLFEADRSYLLLWALAYFYGFFIITVLSLWSLKEISHSLLSLSEFASPLKVPFLAAPIVWAPSMAAFIAVLAFSFALGAEARLFTKDFYPASYSITPLFGGADERIAHYLALVIMSAVIALTLIASFFILRSYKTLHNQ